MPLPDFALDERSILTHTPSRIELKLPQPTTQRDTSGASVSGLKQFDWVAGRVVAQDLAAVNTAHDVIAESGRAEPLDRRRKDRPGSARIQID